LSQGCATSLVGTLVLEAKLGIGALVGMCGYLPFREGLERVVSEEKEEGGEDDGLFERDDENDGERKTKFEMAVEWLREELEIEGKEKSGVQNIPVFMGHGVDDEKVPVEFGRKAAEFLEDVGVKVTWKEYESLGHWYNTDMLRDVIAFLKGLEGWEDADTAKD
jgi:hypothetical protein